MDGEADALALDDARIEDSATCEGCGATCYCSEVVLSPYEADDGGAYCAECAAKEWARTVEEAARYKAALAFYADADNWTLAKRTPGSPWVMAGAAWPDKGERARAALAPAAGADAGGGDGD